jgi:hypothetical protein
MLARFRKPPAPWLRPARGAQVGGTHGSQAKPLLWLLLRLHNLQNSVCNDQQITYSCAAKLLGVAFVIWLALILLCYVYLYHIHFLGYLNYILNIPLRIRVSVFLPDRDIVVSLYQYRHICISNR